MTRRTWLATVVAWLTARYAVRTRAESILPVPDDWPSANAINLHLADGDWIARMEPFEGQAYGEGTHLYVWTHAGRFFRVEDADRGWRVYEWQTNVWAAQSDATGWRNLWA